MKKKKGFIFDLDGVIVDTAKYHYLAWKKLANEIGLDITLEDNERLKGVSRMDSLDIILALGGLQFSEAEKLAMADKKNAWFVDYVNQMMTEKDFKPNPTVLCNFCDYLQNCPEGKTKSFNQNVYGEVNW
jgi:beta-phosphoglucomutase-like phosphatase (HAD superfamily)